MLQPKKWFFLRGIRYTILPALTMNGYVACDIMKGSRSKERFRTFILSQVVSILIYRVFKFILTIIKFIKLILIFSNESFSKKKNNVFVMDNSKKT